ncbi:PIG-L family deacetylase [Parerythrobacter aestuarii]|uniref:PIG-L family deacetylase n=1 Tax=Parerythrobacter aestuarii TaxID=3020909 RepID=UPI0024DF06C9|nr:PIG-L family deacetylase [Parerythrobacter aestuarii]
MRKRLAVMAGIGATVAAFPALTTAHPGEYHRVIVAVLAHPDDELVFAPALAAEARSGSVVHLVYVTSGDAGPGVSDFEKGEALAEARRAEARCAAEALGAQAVDFLDYGDGTLADRPQDPNSPAKKLIPVLTNAMLIANPEIVITWGPDGGYGHGDHRMVSALVAQILQQDDEDVRAKLLHPALINTPLPEQLAVQGWATTAPDLASVRVAYSEADLAAADAAAQCHKTQFDEATRAALVPGFHQGVWKGEVAFREAF